ncbi:MAG TPA: bacillithiol biosynthesis deacetylase BshB1 [Fibrobacteria bacterium]|nr:bacillithiol biosynthesis deacetylase BshB1 [Fibrobacteria bacterium]
MKKTTGLPAAPAARRKTAGAKATRATEGVDFMVVAAHPADAELFGAGTFLKLRALGRTGVLVDVTDGGAGTRGSATIRAREAAAAARMLRMPRVCLEQPDGRVRNTIEAQAALVELIRLHRPKVLFTHHPAEEHPDHGATALLVKEALFRAGLRKFTREDGSLVAGEPFRPGRIYHAVHSALSVTPSFCVDVTAQWEKKLRVIRCYASQFHHAAAGRYAGKTDLATPAFLDAMEVRARFFGQRIRRRYAEAFWCEELAEVEDPTALGLERFP